ncbi:MAG: cytochrome c553 [Gammaproteobacteria bacterium]|jgi:cytochrome c553
MKISHALKLLVLSTFMSVSVSSLAAGDAVAGKNRAQELGCPACHGIDGNGATPRIPQAPKLAGQYAKYIVHALKAYRTGKRQNAIMGGFAGALTDEDRENIAAHYASQTGLRVVER